MGEFTISLALPPRRFDNDCLRGARPPLAISGSAFGAYSMFRITTLLLAFAFSAAPAWTQDEKAPAPKIHEPFEVKSAPSKTGAPGKAPADAGIPGEVEVNFLN